MTEIDERQQKRAANIVWNCAGRYDFRPDFRAYDVKGRADLYWNCIFGAARKHYDYAVFAQIFAGLQQYEDADTYTDLFWLGLENCVYQRELPQRPALEALRRRYAEQFVRQHQGAEDFQFYDSLALAHFSRVLGLESRMNKYDSKLLDELEFTPDMTETEIAARAKELFERWFQICTEERRRAQKRSFTQPFKKRGILDAGGLDNFRHTVGIKQGGERLQCIRIDQHQPWLPERAHQVFSLRQVYPYLAAYGAVHLRQKRGRHLHKGNAP